MEERKFEGSRLQDKGIGILGQSSLPEGKINHAGGREAVQSWSLWRELPLVKCAERGASDGEKGRFSATSDFSLLTMYLLHCLTTVNFQNINTPVFMCQ